MAIRFHCECGQAITMPDAAAGRTGTCVKCGKAMLVPEPDVAIVSESDAAPQSRHATPPPLPQSHADGFDAAVNAALSSGDDEPRRCPHCIEPIAHAATRCPHCTALLAARGAATPTRSRTLSRYQLIGLAIIALAIWMLDLALRMHTAASQGATPMVKAFLTNALGVEMMLAAACGVVGVVVVMLGGMEKSLRALAGEPDDRQLLDVCSRGHALAFARTLGVVTGVPLVIAIALGVVRAVLAAFQAALAN